MKKINNMAKCFVIQPFDNGKYDKRYNDTLKPTIEECGLESYRVDKDPGSQIPIDDIDLQIRNSEICLADITEDNPNVWFELGLAIAYDRDVILICSADRDERSKKFPFDVQHRAIISYSTESASDFEKLKQKIKDKINALIQTSKIKPNHSDDVKDSKLTNGLELYEIAILVCIASNSDNPDGGVFVNFIKDQLKKNNFTSLAFFLGIRRLMVIDFIEFKIEAGYDNEECSLYKLTDKGIQWLMENKANLKLQHSSISGKESETQNDGGFADDITF
jgi:hypothetical protein